MYSSRLILSLSPLISKSLFEITCDEVGRLFKVTPKDKCVGEIIDLHGEMAEFGRACYALITITPISEIIGEVQSGKYSGLANQSDFIDVIKYYLYSEEFKSQLDNITAVVKDEIKNYTAVMMKQDAHIAKEVLYGVSTNGTPVSDKVEKFFEEVYSKGCFLTNNMNIFMLYSRVSFLRYGLRNSAVNKKRGGKGPTNRVLFNNNAELSTALENDFYNWTKTGINMDSERDNTIIMTKVMGLYLNEYFLPEWFSKYMPKHVSSSMGTVYKGTTLSQVDLMTLPVIHAEEVDVNLVLNRIEKVSRLLFGHSTAYKQDATNDIQYTILEYYIEKVLSKDIYKLSRAANKALQGSRTNMFVLDTNYKAGRLINTSATADSSFLKRIKNNIRLITEIDEQRTKLTQNNLIQIYKNIAFMSVSNADVKNSNYSYIPEKLTQSPDTWVDFIYMSIGDVVQCLCDIDNLNSALRYYGLSIVDVFSMAKLNTNFYDDLTTIESLVIAITSVTFDDEVNMDDGVKTVGTFMGMRWNALQEFLPHNTRPNSNPSLKFITTVGKPSVMTGVKKQQNTELFSGIMQYAEKVTALKPIPGVVQLTNILYQMVGGGFNLTTSDLYYEIDRGLVDCNLTHDNGSLDVEALTDYHERNFEYDIYVMTANFYAELDNNPFCRVIGSRYVLTVNREPFIELFGENNYNSMRSCLVKYVDSATKTAIPISKLNTAIAADVAHPKILGGDESILMSKLCADTITELIDSRAGKLRETIQNSKSDDFMARFALLQENDLPEILFSTIVSATYELGKIGLERYLLGRQDTLGIYSGNYNEYELPIEIKVKDVSSDTITIRPLDIDGSAVMVENGEDVNSDIAKDRLSNGVLAPYILKIQTIGAIKTNAHYPLFQPALDTINGLTCFGRTLLQKIFGAEWLRHMYILKNIGILTDFILTYCMISITIHTKVNGYYKSDKGIAFLLGIVTRKYKESLKGTNTKDQCFIELSMGLLNLSTKMVAFQEFITSISRVAQYSGTGRLSDVLTILHDNELSGYRNTTMQTSEFKEDYMMMQTDIIVATVMYVIKSETADWSAFAKQLELEYYNIKNFVEKSTALSAVKNLSIKTEFDMYPAYRNTLLQAMQSQEYIMQTVCMSGHIKSLDFDRFKEGKLSCQDGFLQYDNGKHVYIEKDNDSLVFIHEYGLMFYVILGTDKVEIKPFDISEIGE